MIARTAAACLLVICLAAFTACARRDEPPPAVDGRSKGAFNAWKAKVASRFTPEQWREFDAAVQEIRLRTMGREGVSGAAAIDAVFLTRVGGRSFADVVRLGWEIKLERLEQLRADLQRMVDANALIVVPPGDAELADTLNSRRREQLKRLEALHAELTATRKRVVELGGNPEYAATLASNQAVAGVLSRDDALRAADAMLELARGTMLLQYGRGVVDLDPRGQWLTGAQREDFERRRKASATDGSTVMAVRIKGEWQVFDGHIEPIELPPGAASLTEADRAQIAERWTRLQVELWVRKKLHAELFGEESARNGSAAQQ